MPRLGKPPAAILLLALLLLAGCSSAPAGPTSTTLASTAAEAPHIHGNRTALAAPPILTETDCAGIETVAPMPMQDALALLPPDYTPVPFQVLVGGPAAP